MHWSARGKQARQDGMQSTMPVNHTHTYPPSHIHTHTHTYTLLHTHTYTHGFLWFWLNDVCDTWLFNVNWNWKSAFVSLCPGMFLSPITSFHTWIEDCFYSQKLSPCSPLWTMVSLAQKTVFTSQVEHVILCLYCPCHSYCVHRESFWKCSAKRK